MLTTFELNHYTVKLNRLGVLTRSKGLNRAILHLSNHRWCTLNATGKDHRTYERHQPSEGHLHTHTNSLYYRNNRFHYRDRIPSIAPTQPNYKTPRKLRIGSLTSFTTCQLWKLHLNTNSLAYHCLVKLSPALARQTASRSPRPCIATITTFPRGHHDDHPGHHDAGRQHPAL